VAPQSQFVVQARQAGLGGARDIANNDNVPQRALPAGK
jgi:hypothetical protein